MQTFLSSSIMTQLIIIFLAFVSSVETSCGCGPDIGGKDSICAYIEKGREVFFTQGEYQLLR
jgi:hypothetical protein